MLLPIVLVLAGFAFVIAEVFFVSMGLLSLIAGTLILAADVLAFQQHPAFGWTLIGLEIVLIPLLVRGAFLVLPKLPFGRRMLLAGPATRPRHGTPDYDDLVGTEGRALSDLRPSGTVDFDGRRVSVVAVGRFLPRDTRVRVTAVDGSEVRVRPVTPLPDPDEDSIL